MSPDTRKVQVEVDGRTLTLSNLDKVLYPAAGFTKAQVIDYYLKVAPVMLPHIAARAVTIKRYPEGVDAEFFYQKNAPAHRPDWVPTAKIASPGSTKSRDTIEYILGGDLPTLIWAANLAALELHTPMWRYPHRWRARPAGLRPGPGAARHHRGMLPGRAAAAPAAGGPWLHASWRRRRAARGSSCTPRWPA